MLDNVSMVFLGGSIPFVLKLVFSQGLSTPKRTHLRNPTISSTQRRESSAKDEDEARRILIPTIRVGVREGYFGF